MINYINFGYIANLFTIEQNSVIAFQKLVLTTIKVTKGNSLFLKGLTKPKKIKWGKIL